MKQDEFEYMEKILIGFRYADVQSFANILAHVRYHERDANDVVDFVATKHALLKKQQMGKRPCPACQTKMDLFPVNTNKMDQVGGKWKSQWKCSHCEYEQFSINRPEVEFENQIKRRMNNGTR